MRHSGLALLLALALTLVGCRSDGSNGGAPGGAGAGGSVVDSGGGADAGSGSGGGSDSGSGSDKGSGGGTGGGALQTPQAFFAASVAPNLAHCRGCHLPGAIADVPGGDRFLLAPDPAGDYAALQASWRALGEGVDSNPLLTMPSDEALNHSGNQPWRRGSQAYSAMRTLLGCWDDPDNCTLGDGGDIAELPPLLGSKRGRHVWAEFCDNNPPQATLPEDPRSLVTSGRYQGKTVFFNGWWEDCHAALPETEQHPKTCEDYLERRDRGRDFLLNELPVAAMSAEDFRNSWQKWGLDERPDDFDAMYTLRYGLNVAPFDNPYPLQGEDPKLTNGGSGQLPLGLRQLKDDNGNWTGQIGTAACFSCHGGQIGDPKAGEQAVLSMANLGLGNNNYDAIMAARDGSPFAGSELVDLLPPIDGNTLFNVGIKQRGQNNAVGAFEFLNTLLDLDSLGFNPNPLKTMGGDSGVQDVSHPLAHTQDTPPWWNMGSRPRKFFDAGVSNDSTRIIMAAGPGELGELFSVDGKYYRDRIEQYDQDLEAFFLSLESPAWPGEIDEALAEQGAVLFHSKDLWAQPGNADRPRPPGGNGSCASCHGAYSPRYVNDPNYLEDPRLEGIASHISPLAVIGTDRARSDMLTPTLREGWDTTYWGYPEGAEGYVAPGTKDPLTEAADDVAPNRPVGACGWEKTVIGYQAPPLYGVWATAPYFHNGSVPTLELVLDSSQRPAIWRRQLQSMGPNGEVTGFDQRLGAAFDTGAVGWKHQALHCSDIPGSQEMNCSPVEDEGPSLVQLAQNYLNSTLSWAGLLTIPDPAEGAVDKRLVYDSRILGNGKDGHEFSDVLTEAERKAIIEYLKTL